jgi:4-hydroxybenzoate polyprenyltransferase
MKPLFTRFASPSNLGDLPRPGMFSQSGKNPTSLKPARTSLVMNLGRLMRPANIVTAYADILAGYAAVGATDHRALGLLMIATTGLYGGVVVFNDVFDAKLDAVERPERPIPSGGVSLAARVCLADSFLPAAY